MHSATPTTSVCSHPNVKQHLVVQWATVTPTSVVTCLQASTHLTHCMSSILKTGFLV